MTYPDLRSTPAPSNSAASPSQFEISAQYDEEFVDELRSQEAVAYDPAQSEFDLTSVLADNQAITAQADFDVLPSEDIYNDSEAKGPEIFSSLGERAVKAVTLPIKKETYAKIAEKYLEEQNFR